MAVDPREDRSSFTELVEAAAGFVWDITVGEGDGREVLLIGESFGGLLAPAVALRVANMYERRKRTAARDAMDCEIGITEEPRNPIRGMVLVNPATSFDDTQWDTLGPLLTSLRYLESTDDRGNDEKPALPTPYSVVGGIALSLMVPDANQLKRIVSIFASAKVKLSAEGLAEVLSSMRDGFGILADNLPAEVVEHRVSRWLPVGAQVVNARLEELDVPTLVIAGEDDNMLPTKKEAARLAKTMPNCTTLLIPNTGHFALDDRFNLTLSILENAPFRALDAQPLRRGDATYDPITDWRPPSAATIKETIEGRVRPLRIATSPIFFSTDKEGKRVKGLGQIPVEGNTPILFVANHQFLGLDLSMIIAELIEERGMWVRGLAHPIIFGAGGGRGGGGNNQNDSFQTFGAVMVTPRNYYRLMSTGQNALLFPGGVREVFHNRDEAYQLIWPQDDDSSTGTPRSDFVRTAAKFNATIIPLSAVGGADSATTLVQPRDVPNLPFGIGARAANFSKSVVSARFDRGMEDETFVPPIAVPKPLAARHYFVFGRPVETVDVDPRDRDGCRRVYGEVREELERGLEDVLEVRDGDPYGGTLGRLVYEGVTGGKAPTFSVEELNR